MGRLVSANNQNAQIVQAYDTSGTLKFDSMAVISFDRSRWDLHNYALRYSHDLNGRLVTVQYPVNLLPGGFQRGRLITTMTMSSATSLETREGL